jgi:hypothetical protein
VEDLTLDSDAISASATTPADFALVFDRHFDAFDGIEERVDASSLRRELAEVLARASGSLSPTTSAGPGRN